MTASIYYMWLMGVGPVRGVAFHPTQPLFVSGGDDYKIKVWNYKTRKCLFTLTGHLDYIRTVVFHREHPWILSCSDDQTIRIWNWQSRSCVAVITGHNHYVMCAQFHPTEDLIASASMDQTIRVWDYTGLRKKVSARSQPVAMAASGAGGASSVEEFVRQATVGAGQSDVFGTQDVVVKFVLEGHDRGVDWVTFHPKLPLLVSCGDDRQIKIWRMSETRAWEVDTLRGHFNNVSCALFHPREELILSDSEDKSLRVWDMAKHTTIETFRREHDRFWVLAAHPELNLFAAGHDNGMMIFKLDRERPASCIHQNTLFYIKDKTVRLLDFQTGSDVPVITVKRSGGAFQQPRSMSYNPAERAVLICSDAENGQYDVYTLPKDMHNSSEARDVGEPLRGQGNTAVFISRNRFTVLDKANQQILIKDSGNTTTKTIKLPFAVTEIFYAGPGRLLLATTTNTVLYDVQQKQTLAEIPAANVKYVVWNHDMSMIALIAKHTIVLATGKLEQRCQIHETIRIKSGCWDDSGVFIYSTLNHIKYALTSGDNGIIKTLEQPVYLMRAKGTVLHALERDGSATKMTIDPTEYVFKLALVERKYDEVIKIIRTSNLVGQAVISYLQKKGYSEVALQFVKDKQARFELAMECGNMEVGLETAKAIDKQECWIKLADEALAQGNLKVEEMALQRIKNFEKLSFLYLISGSVDKLARMLKIAEHRNDYQSRFHNALYLGNVEERVKVLIASGHYSLAYVTAKSHGLNDMAESILEAAGLTEDDILDELPAGGTLLKPPVPVLREQANWPTLPVTNNFFGGGFQVVSDTPLAAAMSGANDMGAVGGDWGDDDNVLGVIAVPDEVAEAAWGIDEIELETEFVDASESIIPTMGTSETELWCSNSPLAADHVAAGSFESAMQMLNRQAAIVNFAPLKDHFLKAALSSHAYVSAFPSLPPLAVPLRRNPDETDLRSLLPIVAYNFRTVVTGPLQEAYKTTTSGKFQEAITHFRDILHTLVLTVVTSAAEADEHKQLVGICREYILGLTIETERKQTSDVKRSLELAAYFTHCKLQPIHQQLSLRSAMVLAYNAKNYASASSFARRLLELQPAANVAAKARHIKTASDKNLRDELPTGYDQYAVFECSAMTYEPIHNGTPSLTCPYCGAHYEPEFRGKLCNVCELSQIGASASGLRVFS